MYKITIKTKYNVINLEVEDYNTPEVQEILDQPYVEEVRIEQLKTVEELKKERDDALHHLVGTAYYTEKALKLTKEINEKH